jgi:hypothetical protein
MLRAVVERDSRLAHLFGRDHFFVWPSAIDEHDLGNLPNVRTLTLEKNYRTRTVRVRIEEREPFGIWCLRKRAPVECFWFEYDGTVFEPAPEAEGKLIRVVSDHVNEKLAFGEKILPAHFLPTLRAVLDFLLLSPLAVREVRYEDPALQEVRATMFEGPELYFSLRFSPEGAFGVVGSLLEKDRAGTLSPRFNELQYIDFRVENRAYYK